MVRSVIGGLLGGLAMYIIGFIFWGTPLSALAFSRAGDQESANLQALQTKQQLGVQALSIANSSAGIALSFFR